MEELQHAWPTSEPLAITLLPPPLHQREDRGDGGDDVEPASASTTAALVKNEALWCAALLHVACRRGDAEDALAALGTSPVDAVNTAGETPLLIAARFGHARVVQLLLENGASVESAAVGSSSDATPLRVAANKGHMDVVRALLAASARVDDVESKDGLTILYEAARKGRADVVRTLLEHGAQMYVPNRNELTPLYASARNGHTDVVRVLLKNGDAVDRVNTNNVTPLWIAALKGRLDAVKLLLAYDANVDAADVGGITPLWIAAQEGRAGVVLELLTHGANANASSKDGLTPLLVAAQCGHYTIVKELIAHGAEVDTVNGHGYTSLYFACYNGHPSTAKILLANGANVDGAAHSDIGAGGLLTPLYAAARNGHAGIVLALLSHQARTTSKDLNGATPLHAAAKSGHASIVHALLAKGDADIEAASKDGDTPLHAAARNGCADVAKALLKLGARVDAVNNLQETPLYIACANGHLAIVQALLAKQAGVALSTATGGTPLHAASRNGHASIVQRLLAREAAALVDALDGRGATPLHEASADGHDEVASLLLSVGAKLEIADDGGNTALFVASRGGRIRTVRTLLDAGASVHTRNAVGETAALAAGSFGHFAVLEELVKTGGASVHVRGAGVCGETMLIAAARWGNASVVNFLIEHGKLTSLSQLQRQEQHGGTACGDQDSLVPATLQTLQAYGSQLHEFSALWDRVATRLHDISGLLEKQREESISAAAMDQFLMIIFRIVRLKLVWEKQNLFTRLVASRNAASAFQDVHTEIDHLQRTVSLTATRTAPQNHWRVEWRSDQENLTEVFWDIVEDDDKLERHMSQGADVNEAILLLLYEINAHSNQCTQRKLELLEFSLKKLSRRAGSAAVVQLPQWFLPQHELELEHSTGSAQHPRSSKPCSGKWLNATVLIRECHLEQDAVVQFGDKWFQLSHPNVIKVFGVYHLRKPYLVVFENAPVTSLREYLASEAKNLASAPHLIWQKLYEVALGLKYLHDRGIILGKLQCGNIWISTGGLAKIAECQLDVINLMAPSPDEPNELRWVAAECLEGEPATTASDVYSLGICIVEAFMGRDPWHGKTNRKAKSLIAWGLLPSQPLQLNKAQWSLVSEMCAFDPLKRAKLANIVEHLKQFAAPKDSGANVDAAAGGRHQKQIHGHLTAFDLAGRVFPELGSSINAFLTRLERKLGMCADAREYVTHVHARLSNIYAWLQQGSSVASEIAAAKFCQVLVSFDHFLAVAVSQTSVIRQAMSRKVSLNNNVLHREIDELLVFLSMETVDSIHKWNASGSSSTGSSLSSELLVSITESESDSVKSERDDGRGGQFTSGQGKTGSGSDDTVRFVQFESKHVNQKFAPMAIRSFTSAAAAAAVAATDGGENSETPPWFIPLYDLKFREEDCLGIGAFGKVYRGAWLSTPVVVKMMGYEDADDATGSTQTMFLHELRVWYPLNHPHVVKLFGACHVGKRFFVCELAANGTLRDFLSRDGGGGGGRSTWQKLYEVALGLQYLHDQNIVHNDLKCDNFLVGADGKVKITDFGLSCISDMTEIQVDLSKLGAQRWKAPEYLRGERSTLASDVYSLGMCILEAATGTLPWGAMADAFVRRNVHRGQLPRRPDAVSARQWTLVEMMCASDSLHRLRIATVVERLQEFAQSAW